MMRSHGRPKQQKEIPNKMKTKILQKAFNITHGNRRHPECALLGGPTTSSRPESPGPSKATAHQLTAVSSVCNGDVREVVFVGRGTVNVVGPSNGDYCCWRRTSAAIPATPTRQRPLSSGPVGPSQSPTRPDGSAQARHAMVSPDTIQGVWNVTGGTGQFSGIIGSGADQGTIAGQGRPKCTLERDRRVLMPNCMQQVLKPTS